VLGLEDRADDYIVKPFSVREAVARSGGFPRAKGDRGAGAIRTATCWWTPSAGRIARARRRWTLAMKEFDLLAYLIPSERVITRGHYWSVWGMSYWETRTVAFTSATSQKIEDNPEIPGKRNVRAWDTLPGAGRRGWPMSRRILQYGLSLISCAVAVMGLATGFLFHGYYIDALTRNMSGIVCLTGSRIADLAEGEASRSRYEDIVRETVEDINSPNGAAVRVTLSAAAGTVLADSDEDAAVMENHGGRPEGAAALTRPGEIATSSRYSATVGYSMLYTAVYDEAAGVVVRAAIALTALRQVYVQIALFCLLGLAAGMAAAIPLSFALSGGITRPIARLAAAAHGIAKGRYEPIAGLNTGTEFDALAADFNVMSARLRETVNELTDRNAQLNAVLTCMTGGLLAVDAAGRVILINPQARVWLDLPATCR
jgi:HAMP domain-containing protein